MMKTLPALAVFVVAYYVLWLLTRPWWLLRNFVKVLAGDEEHV